MRIRSKPRILPAFDRIRIDEIEPEDLAVWFDEASGGGPARPFTRSKEQGYCEHDTNPCFGTGRSSRQDPVSEHRRTPRGRRLTNHDVMYAMNERCGSDRRSSDRRGRFRIHPVLSWNRFLTMAGGGGMGEIAVNIELENPEDRGLFERGHGQESDIRRTSIEAIVDTGSVMPVLPRNVVERLGVRTRRTAIVTYADERKEERPVAGPLTIHVCNRFMSTDCVVGPPLGEALIGRIVLAALDLIADCTKRTLTPRPESPDYPLLKLKRSFSAPSNCGNQ